MNVADVIVLSAALVLFACLVYFLPHRNGGGVDWLLIVSCMCFFGLGAWTRRRR